MTEASDARTRMTVSYSDVHTRKALVPLQVNELKALLDRGAATVTAGGGTMSATDTTEVAVATGWSGVIAQEGVDTGDGRRIEQGALGWRALPLTLMAQLVTPGAMDGGHADAQVAGRIESIDRAGADIVAVGVFDSGAHGAETQRLVAEGTLRGISIDLAVNQAEVIPDPNVEDEMEAYFMGTLLVLDGTILGATVVPFPAFENATIAITAGAAMRLGRARVEQVNGERKQVVSFFMPFAPMKPGGAPMKPDPNMDPEEADPNDASDDATAAIADITDAVNGWPGLTGHVMIVIDGNETKVEFPPASADGSEPAEASSEVHEALAVLTKHLKRKAAR